MKLHTTQKLQRWKGRIVCWIEFQPRKVSMHLSSITQKYRFPATICGLPVLTYVVVDKNYDCATYDGRQLCKQCIGQLESDHVTTDDEPNPQWKGRSVSQWMAEFERLQANCQHFDRKCRELSIDLGASKAEAEELHRQIERLKRPPHGFFKKAALYLLGGNNEG